MSARLCNLAHRVAIGRLAPACIGLAFVALLAPSANAQEARVAVPAEIQKDITFLASRALAGRGSGYPGNEVAARYIAVTFKQCGLRPLGTSRQRDTASPLNGSGYFQPFSFPAGVRFGTFSALSVKYGGVTHELAPVTEFAPAPLSSSGSAAGSLAFLGFGIDAPKLNHTDYRNVDARKRIVLVIDGSPGNNPHAPLAEFASLRRKVVAARDHGAAAVIVALTRFSSPIVQRIDADVQSAGVPVILMRRTPASALLRSAGIDLVQYELASGPPDAIQPIQVVVALRADVRRVTRISANIAGLLPGSDPTLRTQVVILGAHMDHLGMGGPGSLAADPRPQIHPGADDNGSGTAGVLAIARRYSHLAVRPRRSILFICFSGEELGLLGSEHYVKHPLVALAQTVAMVNMDMVGRLHKNSLIVLGTGTSPSWNSLIDGLNKRFKFALSKSESGFGASDQQSFYAAHLPVLFYFTGLHEDYHRPSDTADKINAVGEVRVLEMVAASLSAIANMPERPKFSKMPEAKPGGIARFRSSLGSIPDYASQAVGVELSGVRPGSAADKAGLRRGDIIVEFGGHSVRGVEDYALVFGEHGPGDSVRIKVLRGGKRVELTAIMDPPTGR